MRIPEIALFTEGDYGEVVSLIEAEGLSPPMSPSELVSGLGLIARDERNEDHPVIGFAWALAAHGNPVAYLDYFAVSESVVKSNVGVWLMGTLVTMLRDRGIKKIVGFVPQDHYQTLRTYMKRGGRNLGLHYVVELPLVSGNGHG